MFLLKNNAGEHSSEGLGPFFHSVSGGNLHHPFGKEAGQELPREGEQIKEKQCVGWVCLQ